MRSLLTRWLIVTLVLVVVGPFAAAIAGVKLPPPEPGTAAADPAALLGWSVLSNGIIAFVLVGLAASSRVRGWTLAAGLFAVAFGIGYLSAMVEAYVFRVLDGETSARVLLMSGLTSGAASGIAAWLTRPDAATAAEDTVAWRPSFTRLALVSGLYLATYYAAGTLVFPYVESFYATRGLPTSGVVVSLQLFVRGPFFALILAWIAASTRGSRLARACWAGVALSLLGGVAPLIMPNPYFTDAVRWAHFVETSVSNLIFGAAASWIFTAPPMRQERAAFSRA